MRSSLKKGIAITNLLSDVEFEWLSAGREFRGQPEFDVLLPTGQHRHLDWSDPPQGLDDVVHQHFGRRRARSDTDSTGVSQPVRIQFAPIGDQIAWDAGLGADLTQPVGVGTVGGSHHQDYIHQLPQVPYRRLPVLSRIADIPDVRTLNV